MPLTPDFSYEQPLWEQGYQYVAGIDEAGRGALAGPVAAAALILSPTTSQLSALEGVRDSKQMTPKQRTYWAELLRDIALAWGIGFASAQEIDAIGIVSATRLAIRRSLGELQAHPEYLLVDYLELPEISIEQLSITKGDARSLSIAAASILAKTSRDAVLCQAALDYPGYGFARHKGYGTQAHFAALAHLGPSPIHRLSFKPLAAERTRVSDL